MSFHTARSPSQAKRFAGCPGTLAFCATLDDVHKNQSGAAAQIGTATHGLIERCLKEGSQPEDYRGRIIELIGDEESVVILRANAKLPGRNRVFFIIDSDIIDGAEMMCTYVRERCKELGIPESDLQLETRTNPLPDRDDTSGTADVTIDAWPLLLEVADYKNGYILVDHEDNDQLLAYLLGKALEAGMSHESYRVTVIQPHAPHPEGRIRWVDATAEELLAFQAQYRTAIETCEEAEAALEAVAESELGVDEVELKAWTDKWLHAGDHCFFCDAQAVCPARTRLAQDQATTDFDDMPNEILFPNRDVEVAKRLKWAPYLDNYVKALKLYALRSMAAGFKVPGWKIVEGRSNRTWIDEEPVKIAAAIVKKGYVEDKAKLFSPPALLSGPQIEKLITPAKRRKEFAAEFLVKPAGKLTLAPESDPREAVACGPGEDFDEDVVED